MADPPEPNGSNKDDDPRVQTVCLLILAATAIAVGLYFLRSVLVPFVLALFLSEAVAPIVGFQVRRLRFPRVIALGVTGAVTVIALVLVSGFVSSSVSEIRRNAVDYRESLNALTEDIVVFLRDLGLQLPGPEGEAAEPNPVASEEGKKDEESHMPRPDLRQVLRLSGGAVHTLLLSTATEVLGLLSNLAVVLVFLLFLMLGGSGPAAAAGTLTREIREKSRQYIVTKVWVSAVTGSFVAVVLSILGVDLALVFGLFAFLLNFIPSIGSVIATLLPLPVVLLQPDLSIPVRVLALGLPGAFQFFVGNFLEPRLMGQSLAIHPVVVLLSLIFWGTIWGMVGMFLAIPLTAVVKIVLERLDQTRPVAALIEGNLELMDAALSGKRTGADSAARG